LTLLKKIGNIFKEHIFLRHGNIEWFKKTCKNTILFVYVISIAVGIIFQCIFLGVFGVLFILIGYYVNGLKSNGKYKVYSIYIPYHEIGYSYYKNGKLHRIDGPAIDVYGKADEKYSEYFVNGKKLSKESFDKYIVHEKFKML
jgi:hypothetical protein